MYTIEFRDHDGKLGKVTQEISNWIDEHHPIRPQLMIVSQMPDDYILIILVCEDYN